MEYNRAEPVSMKQHPELNERWLQKLLVDDPGLLGLGNLVVKDVERRQPGAGRLDLLLVDPESRTRYEVEVQLGATDESHIIRTIEYWDNERERFPNDEHVAVIVAENITSRFLNVINLFHRRIPLIAIQMRCFEVNGAATLIATKVLDVTPLAAAEEDEGGGADADRTYWEKNGSSASMAIADSVLEMLRELDPKLSLNYTLHYVGLARSGVADNFVIFQPRKRFVISSFRISRSEEFDASMEQEGLDTLDYDTQWSRYRVRLTKEDLDKRREVLMRLCKLAYDESKN